MPLLKKNVTNLKKIKKVLYLLSLDISIIEWESLLKNSNSQLNVPIQESIYIWHICQR